MGIGGGLDNEGDLEPDVDSVPLDLGMTGKRFPLFGGFGGSVVSLRIVVKTKRLFMELDERVGIVTFGRYTQVREMLQLVCFLRIF